jgi:hypothetical protein
LRNEDLQAHQQQQVQTLLPATASTMCLLLGAVLMVEFITTIT